MGGQRAAGLILLGVGAALLLVTLTDVDLGRWVVLIVGLAFGVAYVATRRYGLLVPAGVVTGLGAGIVLDASGVGDGVVPLGLGLGFLSIAVIHLLSGDVRDGGWWWPLIPGGILTVVGGSQLAAIEDVGRFVAPAVLIALGLLLLVRSVGRAKDDGPPPPPTGQ